MSKIAEGEHIKIYRRIKGNNLVEFHPLNLYKSVRSRLWRGQVKITKE